MKKCYTTNKSLEFKKFQDKTLVCDTSNNKAILLGEIETFIWDNAEGKSIEEMISLAEENYEGSNIQEDIKEYYNKLLDNGIILAVEKEN